MRKVIDFEGPKSNIEFPEEERLQEEWFLQEGEAVSKYLGQIVDFLRKSLEWELVQHIHVDVLLLEFQKNGTKVSLVYDSMTGIEIVTHDDTFDLESLFNEINEHLKNEA